MKRRVALISYIIFFLGGGGGDDFAPLKIKIIDKNAQLPCPPPSPPLNKSSQTHIKNFTSFQNVESEHK